MAGLSRVQRFNKTHAPSPSKLPPAGISDHPGLYHPDRGHVSFEEATRWFQNQAGLHVDGMFGPSTFAAFLAAYDTPSAPFDGTPTTGRCVDLQVWVGWGVLDKAELSWLKRLGVGTLIFNLNADNTGGTWGWRDGKQGARTLQDMQLAKAMGFQVIGMIWAWRSGTFNRIAAVQLRRLHKEVGLDGIQFDVEGSWVHSMQGTKLTHQGIVDRYWRPYWQPFFEEYPEVACSATPLYFLREAVDTLLDEPEMGAIYPQAYSPWLPGTSAKAKATHADSFRAPRLQRLAMRNYKPFRRNAKGKVVQILGGVGGFHLKTPTQTPTESMLAQASAFVEGGADGLCLWALHTIQVGRGRAWPDEAEHRAAWERVCLEYGPGAGADVQQPHVTTDVPQEEIAPGVTLVHSASWWQRLADPYRPPVPADHKRMGGKPLGRKVYATAIHIRKLGLPEGTYLPFVVDGQAWVSVTCRHTHTHNDQGQVVEVPGGTRAVTVFKRTY